MQSTVRFSLKAIKVSLQCASSDSWETEWNEAALLESDQHRGAELQSWDPDYALGRPTETREPLSLVWSLSEVMTLG